MKDIDDNKITRRDLGRKMLFTAFSVSLLETLFSNCSSEKKLVIDETNGIIDRKATQILNHWSIELNEICSDLETTKISQTHWQTQIEKLFTRIELKELLKFIDFEKLTEKFKFPDLGVNTRRVAFPKLDGLPKNTVFLKKIFGLKRGRSIIPHGHSNMASAHFILKGNLSLRQYEKVEEEKDHLIIKPTIDKSIKAGSFSSISDQRDNVHWFIATSEVAFTFDMIMLDLNQKKYEIHNIDLDEAESISKDRVRVKKLDVETALRKYGKDHHTGAVSTL